MKRYNDGNVSRLTHVNPSKRTHPSKTLNDLWCDKLNSANVPSLYKKLTLVSELNGVFIFL